MSSRAADDMILLALFVIAGLAIAWALPAMTRAGNAVDRNVVQVAGRKLRRLADGAAAWWLKDRR